MKECQGNAVCRELCFQGVSRNPLRGGGGRNCGFVWVFFPIMFIAKWFGRVCLLRTALYKQTYVFGYNQTNHAGVFKCMRGNGAFLGFFLVCNAEMDFNGRENQDQNFCWGRSTQFIDFH